jgi:hypothetical protein
MYVLVSSVQICIEPLVSFHLLSALSSTDSRKKVRVK